MSSFRRGERDLSSRLSQLANYYQNETYIWDIGCDHGLLGLSFLDKEEIKAINLVDPSAAVITNLYNTIKDAYITKGKILIHSIHGQDVVLKTQSNCIFIAGMGGQEMQKIVTALLPQLSGTDRLILSPHKGILELRSFLNESFLRLQDEAIIYENGQYYQVLVLTPSTAFKKVSLFGEKFWSTKEGAVYREQQIKIFLRHQDNTSRLYVEYLRALNS